MWGHIITIHPNELLHIKTKKSRINEYKKKKNENIILIIAFWHSDQFDPYILVAVNLVHVIFNLQLIWSLPLSH